VTLRDVSTSEFSTSRVLLESVKNPKKEIDDFLHLYNTPSSLSDRKSRHVDRSKEDRDVTLNSRSALKNAESSKERSVDTLEGKREREKREEEKEKEKGKEKKGMRMRISGREMTCHSAVTTSITLSHTFTM
jgi:hypothetical protein